jgi:predicted nucleic acid-binding protein
VFLVDTDVISAAAPTKAVGRAEALEWVQRHGEALFLSVVTVAELRRGVALLAGKGATQKSAALAEWQEELEIAFGDRIFPIDDSTARRAGDLLGAAEARGHKPGLPDAFIAATADLQGLTVVTRNASHFAALGVAHRAPKF